MRNKQLIMNNIEKAEQICFSVISALNTNVITMEKTLNMLNNLKQFIEEAKELISLEHEN